jgi:Putative DNA-binding domain
MDKRAEQLFERLHDASSIRDLVGQSEDVHFDCKEWSTSDTDATQKMFAKAACGLTNSEGGVLVIGMRARATSKDEPDLVHSAAPVEDTRAVKSRILDLVGQLVEPRIEGFQAIEVNESSDATSGFVVVYIPASEGSPRRSRKDWKFYQRIGSGTFPMEYFQIEERFGKRPHPKLEMYLEPSKYTGMLHNPWGHSRWVALGLRNVGFGIAKFPSIRYHRRCGLIAEQGGIDGVGGFGLPPSPSESEWVTFRGGLNDVIYPEETRIIAKLRQDGVDQTRGSGGRPLVKWIFKAVSFSCEISCEGMRTFTAEKSIPDACVEM